MLSSASLDDTIAAVTSPPGRSWRALIRLSGSQAWSITERIVELSGKAEEVEQAEQTTERVQPWMMQCGRLRDLGISVWVSLFESPRSYTGQDSVEIQLPGNAALVERVLMSLIAAGARQAEAGEFTFRAYSLGRMNLLEAEAVAATISAESQSQWRAAKSLEGGRLQTIAHDQVHAIGNLLALTEAGIDFVDQEDVVPIEPGVLLDRLIEEADALSSLLRESRPWAEVTSLPRVALVGLPSVGKSTLFNALLGRERAVIDAVPGTTRDVLSEVATIAEQPAPIEIMLVDMAGLEHAMLDMDRLAQQAAQRELERVDLVLAIHDGRTSQTDWGANLPVDVPRIMVRSKADLENLKAINATDETDASEVLVSTKTGQGIDALKDRIKQTLGSKAGASQSLALQPRHAQAIRSALESLEQATAMLEPQRDSRALHHVELIAGSIREALDALADLGGHLTPDDVIGKVFATFCVGK